MNFGFVILLALLSPQLVHIGDNPAELTAVKAFEILTYTEPFYTRAARENRIEGIVTVEASFDVNGKMRILRTLKSLGYGLDENAIDALRNWKFAPALRNGVATDAIAQIDINFNLAAAPPAEFDDIKTMGEPGMSGPTVLKRVEPRYTAEAPSARFQGTVVLQAVIQTDGTPAIVKIVQPLPFGLTESAVEAIQQWKFTPAVQNGKKVAVSTNIEVNFNLEGKRQ